MARFREIDLLPRQQNAKASFGTVIHHCLEMLNNGAELEAALEAFKDLWHNPEKLGVAPDKWPKFTTYGGLRERGLGIIRDYHEMHKWGDREVLATEHHFLVPFGRHELEGSVDCLELRRSGKGKTLLIVNDYKTNTRKPTIAQLTANIQFTTYIYGSLQPEFWLGNGPDFPPIPNGEWLFQTLAQVPRRGMWTHLWSMSEVDAGDRDDDDFMRLYRACEEIERAIEHQVFVPCISGDTCGLCDYANDPCPVRVPTREELAAEENAWL